MMLTTTVQELNNSFKKKVIFDLQLHLVYKLLDHEKLNPLLSQASKRLPCTLPINSISMAFALACAANS